MVKNIKVVVGANFGDEGKGLMTDYFCHRVSSRKEKCIVVLHNGGAQRGHTVTTPDYKRHVFHHFGSGTFTGAATYFSKDFILNPMVFRKEWEELKSFGYEPRVYVNGGCRVTTPYEMIVNQIKEEIRAKNKHGSCGMGIYETVRRYKDYSWSLSVKDTLSLTGYEFLINLQRVRDIYVYNQLVEVGNENISAEWMKIINSYGLISNFYDDLEFMRNHIVFADDSILETYENIIFENGQGLLLDQNNMEYFPNLTPSNTGVKNPCRIISERFSDADIEVCYVTRPYLTRHGAGRLDNECSKDEISPYIMDDLTNVPNEHQGSLRYGKMDAKKLHDRILKDFSETKHLKAKLSLAITHRDESKSLGWEYVNWTKNFYRACESYGYDRNSVVKTGE